MTLPSSDSLTFRTQEEWKGTNLCEAVYTSIGELDNYHRKSSKFDWGNPDPDYVKSFMSNLTRKVVTHKDFNSMDNLHVCLQELGIEGDLIILYESSGIYEQI